MTRRRSSTRLTPRGRAVLEFLVALLVGALLGLLLGGAGVIGYHLHHTTQPVTERTHP